MATSILQPLLGIVVIVALAFLLGQRRSFISWRLVGAAIVSQALVALIVLHFSPVQTFFVFLNRGVLALDASAKYGASFMFGYLGGAPTPFEQTGPGTSFIIAFQVLPLIILVCSLSALLFHWGIIQKAVHGLSWGLQRTMGIHGPTGLGVASTFFLGVIEAPLFIKPYLALMSSSQLFMLITASMATVAGTVMVLYANVLAGVVETPIGHIITGSIMSLPAAVAIAHLLMPDSVDSLSAPCLPQPQTHSAFEAMMEGAQEGIHLVINIAGVIVVLFSLVHLLNLALGLWPWTSLSIESMVAVMFVPFMWLLGIPLGELWPAAQLMATKTVLNEFVAYSQLAQLPADSLSSATKLVLTYAMCGFANFASVGILVAGLGTVMPQRKAEIAGLALKALVAATLATLMTGCFVGILAPMTEMS